MTSETRTFIEPSDITGIEIECLECHLTTLYPVAKLVTIGQACSHCHHKMFDELHAKPYEGMTIPAIDNIQKIVEQLRVLTRAERTDIHARIRLCINLVAQ